MRLSVVHVSFLLMYADPIIIGFGIVSRQLQSREGRTKNRAVYFKEQPGHGSVCDQLWGTCSIPDGSR